MAAGRLWVIATPIGNLDDLSARAADVLRAVSLVAAEDTRHSAPLLARVGKGAGRPLLAGDAEESVRRIDAERRDAYNRVAHVVVDVDGLTADQVADDVLRAVHGEERAS